MKSSGTVVAQVRSRNSLPRKFTIAEPDPSSFYDLVRMGITGTDAPPVDRCFDTALGEALLLRSFSQQLQTLLRAENDELFWILQRLLKHQCT